MRHDSELYRSIALRNYHDRLFWYTKKLSEINPAIQRVEVKASIEFRSEVLRHPVVEQYDELFTPDKVMRLVFKCPNPDCTSGYFDEYKDKLLIQTQVAKGLNYRLNSKWIHLDFMLNEMWLKRREQVTGLQQH